MGREADEGSRWGPDFRQQQGEDDGSPSPCYSLFLVFFKLQAVVARERLVVDNIWRSQFRWDPIGKGGAANLSPNHPAKMGTLKTGRHIVPAKPPARVAVGLLKTVVHHELEEEPWSLEDPWLLSDVLLDALSLLLSGAEVSLLEGSGSLEEGGSGWLGSGAGSGVGSGVGSG